jgi:MoaA/NifB/PqqE/SkfB family radical SAM enzyme
MIVFPVTHRCNLRCAYCGVVKNHSIVDTAASLTALLSLEPTWVYITGGEPLLVPDIAYIVDALKGRGHQVGLTTNGTIKNHEIAGHVDRLGVSIDGPREVHDQIRGAGNFDKACAFLQTIIGRTETVMLTTLCETNRQYEPDITALAQSLGVDILQLRNEV